MKRNPSTAIALALAMAAVSAPAWADQFACTPLTIGDFGNRVAIHCNGSPNEIHDFAIGSADPNRAARIMALGSGAFLGGYALDIGYDLQDTSGAAYGCDPNSCRPILSIAIMAVVPI